MVKITGKYLEESNENLDNYFKNMGLQEQLKQKFVGPNFGVTILEDSNKVTYTTVTGISYSIPLDEEYNEPLIAGAKSVSKRTPTGFTVTTKFPNGDDTNETVYEFTKETHSVVMIFNGVTARRYFKRVM